LTFLSVKNRIKKNNIEVLRGRVKIPTGGIVREPKGRFGEIPKPTVKSGCEKNWTDGLT